MNARRGKLLGLALLAILFFVPAGLVSGQAKSGTKSNSTGEWQFDGTQWQFQSDGGAAIPSQLPPVTPTYPQTTYPGKAITSPATITIGRPGPYWLVRYKKQTSDPWYYYATYSSSTSAFSAATSLSHKGYWAAVTHKRY
jgi:hypothetical protein